MKSQTLLSAALLLGILLNMSVAIAGDGHDHGDGATATNANGPQRMPDGSVFLPKPAQRQLGIRTFEAVQATLPRTTALSGKVMMDPNAGGKVQPTISGRIEPGPRGLPSAGQSVRKGEVLAYVIQTSGQIERSNQVSQIAELRSVRALAEKRLARQKELIDTIARKEIEATENEIASLGVRIGALGSGLNSRETLVAPISGVIASANAVNGQVVEARELLFEIVDPTRMRIEALAFDPAMASDVGAASIAIGDQRTPISFVGAARSLREQSLPLYFKANDRALMALAIGQPVSVYVQSKTKINAIAVAASSLLKSPSNQTIVWVKTAPEKFEPRVVVTAPLDGVSVAVTAGLKPGDRIATSGATLINQVR
jgi:membrane fusion protein, heavy metal efflux system